MSTKKTPAATAAPAQEGPKFRVLRGFDTAAGQRYEIGAVLPVEVLDPHWIGACAPSCTREEHGWMLTGDPVLQPMGGPNDPAPPAPTDPAPPGPVDPAPPAPTDPAPGQKEG